MIYKTVIVLAEKLIHVHPYASVEVFANQADG